MNKELQNFITDMVMGCYGEPFALSRESIYGSLEQLTDLRLRVDVPAFRHMAYYAVHLVPSLLTHDGFLIYMTNAVSDGNAPLGTNLLNYPLCAQPDGELLSIDFNEYDDDAVLMFLDKMSEGNRHIKGYDEVFGYIFKHLDQVHYDLVQFILNNIGTVILLLCTQYRFYAVVQYCIMHYSRHSAPYLKEMLLK